MSNWGAFSRMNGDGVLQTTLRQPVRLSGVGVHTGRAVSVTLNPASADSGISFRRTDVDTARPVKAHPAQVSGTDYCTTLGARELSIGTVEHLLAALSALEVDNVAIDVDGPEIPVMDGSAVAFVTAVEKAGIAQLREPRTYIRILRPVRVTQGLSVAELTPYDGRWIETEIEYDHPLVGRQSYACEVTPDGFANELAPARTYGFLADVERLRGAGLALGASLENALVVGEGEIVNPEGMRFRDEFARHKAVDALGDLALAGAPIIGAFRSYRGGHGVNVKLLRALFADPDAWARVTPAVAAAASPLELGVEVAFGPEMR